MDIFSASYNGNIEELRKAIKGGADLEATNSLGITALQIAAAKGHCSIVKELIFEGANVNGTGKHERTPLHLAAWKNHSEVILELMKHPNIDLTALDQKGNTPLEIMNDDSLKDPELKCSYLVVFNKDREKLEKPKRTKKQLKLEHMMMVLGKSEREERNKSNFSNIRNSTKRAHKQGKK